MNVLCTVLVCIISNHFIIVQAIYPLWTTAEQREKSFSSSRVSLSSDSWKRTHTGTKESQQRMILCSICLPVELTQKVFVASQRKDTTKTSSSPFFASSNVCDAFSVVLSESFNNLLMLMSHSWERKTHLVMRNMMHTHASSWSLVLSISTDDIAR